METIVPATQLALSIKKERPKDRCSGTCILRIVNQIKLLSKDRCEGLHMYPSADGQLQNYTVCLWTF